MKRFALFLLAFLAAGAVLGDALYKWVDDQGVVHYSDKPVPGATKMKVPGAQTFNVPKASALRAPAQNNAPNGGVPGYTQLAITAPTDQQTFSNVHSVTVSVDLEPGLQSGDTLTISVDGKAMTGTATSATFDDLDRGAHTVTATVSSNGNVVIVAKPVTFYIHQATQKSKKSH